MAVWLWFCGPLMLGTTVVGFRDSAYLYFPMFAAIDGVWSQGTIPLWNPFCNFGMPLVADGTSSVFYPGKLVFGLPWASYPSRYGIYQSIHVLLAASSAYWLARQLRCNRPGATLAAISFAFGGPVVFQVTNVIYLVSAAWLPVALGCIWKGINQPRIEWWLGAAVACAMMILGGDPQMVYHVGLIASASIGVSVVRWVIACVNDTRCVRQSRFKLLVRQSMGAVVMVVATSLLAAVQILPTAELAQRSERAAAGRVVNFYSALLSDDGINDGSLLLENTDAIAGQYQFSLPPWTLLEMLVPNVSGKPFPKNARWTDVFPANDRMWFASLYVGLVVVLLASLQFRLWGRNRTSVWISWILLVFLLGSFGWYGGVWLWREIAGLPPGNKLWAPPVGGVYWWMSTTLPKYFSFRYPAKLFVLAALAISLLAGRSLTVSLTAQSARWLVGGTCGILTSATLLGRWILEGKCADVFRDWANHSINAQTMYGPFQEQAAEQYLLDALIHSAILAALSGVLIGFFGNRRLMKMWGAVGRRNRDSAVNTTSDLRTVSGDRSKTAKQSLGWLLVLLTAVDLSIANRWLLAEVPASAFEQSMNAPPQLTDSLAVSDSHLGTGRPRTLVLANHFPIEFLQQPSANRMAELIAWQRQSFQARHHISSRVRLIGSFHSIWPERYQHFVASYVEQANRVLNEGDDWFFDPDFLLAEEGEQLVAFETLIGVNDSLRTMQAELTAGSIIQKDLSSLLVGSYDDVTIEAESLDWNRVSYQLQVDRVPQDRELELPVLFDRGWRVTMSVGNDVCQPVDFRCTDRDLVSVELPEKTGTCKIHLNYRPNHFYVGAIASALTWCGLLVFVMMVAWGQRRSQ